MLSGKVVCLLALACAVAYAEVVVPAIAPGTPLPEPASAEMTAAQQTALRLRKVWGGGDVALMRRVDEATVPTNEESSDLLARFNGKYGVYDRYYDAVKLATQPRADLPPPTTAPISPEGFTAAQEDYKSVFNNANTKLFDPTKDNPNNLENMLGSLWGKRYAHMSQAQKEDSLRNEKVLIIKGTSAATDRLSQAISTDGSVHSWIAHADDAADSVPPPPPTKFKPDSFWYGPKVVGDAIDVTVEALDGHGRTPSEPPKPPIDSYVFAEAKPVDDPASNEAKVTIIERITVTKAGTTSADKRPPEPVFNPIMVNMKDGKLNGPTQKALIV